MLIWQGTHAGSQHRAKKKHFCEKMFSFTRTTKPLTFATRSTVSTASTQRLLAP